ncbi:hypothetical protein GFS31_06210 [Leptolyngbya sp. BL0902]|nr:hypothetical protein GFS31_06210 [Leptolyngbya sp. BL0902]
MAPMPPRPEATEEETTAEEDFVDLLSISSLAAPAPVAETPPPAETPTAPPPAAPPPAAPVAPRIPDSYPDPSALPPAPLEAMAPTDLPTDNLEALSTEDNPPVASSTAVDSNPPPVVVQEQEVLEIVTRLTRGSGESDFDSTATSFPAVAFLTRRGIQEWSAQQQACFFSQISADSYRLAPGAVDVRYLTRNVQFIEQQDVPRTFPTPAYQVSPLPEGYCGHTLFQVLQGGQPLLFISVVGLGVGNPQATGLVIIWSSDPRLGWAP